MSHRVPEPPIGLCCQRGTYGDVVERVGRVSVVLGVVIEAHPRRVFTWLRVGECLIGGPDGGKDLLSPGWPELGQGSSPHGVKHRPFRRR